MQQATQSMTGADYLLELRRLTYALVCAGLLSLVSARVIGSPCSETVHGPFPVELNAELASAVETPPFPVGCPGSVSITLRLRSQAGGEARIRLLLLGDGGRELRRVDQVVGPKETNVSLAYPVQPLGLNAAKKSGERLWKAKVQMLSGSRLTGTLTVVLPRSDNTPVDVKTSGVERLLEGQSAEHVFTLDRHSVGRLVLEASWSPEIPLRVALRKPGGKIAASDVRLAAAEAPERPSRLILTCQLDGHDDLTGDRWAFVLQNPNGRQIERIRVTGRFYPK